MLKLPKTIKMIITDFDGIVTDNNVYINQDMSMTRKINFKDVVGFYLLKNNGFKIAIISGEKNSAIELLAKQFNIEEVHQKVSTKIDILKSIIDKYGLSEEEYVYIGDDINDYDCLSYAKYKITVPHAVKKIKEIPNIQITEEMAGNGAFREVADCLTD